MLQREPVSLAALAGIVAKDCNLRTSVDVPFLHCPPVEQGEQTADKCTDAAFTTTNSFTASN
jgi:hypothetical protein